MLRKHIITYLLLLIATNEISSWTIDLPEARKFYFKKYLKEVSEREKNLVKYDVKAENDTVEFDNIHVDSPLNNEHSHYKNQYDHNAENYRDHKNYGSNNNNDTNAYNYGHNIERQFESKPNNENYNKKEDEKGDEKESPAGRYAENYDYQYYMEKRVNEIVNKGSAYLEGLSQALERYGEELTNCSQYNKEEFANITWLPQNELPPSENATISAIRECDRATRASEYVRRLAELALWATRELQDRVYNKNYQKQTHDEAAEENELLLRLAWFLDKLALLTGFEPPVERGTPRTGSSIPPPSSPPPSVPAETTTVMSLPYYLRKLGRCPPDARGGDCVRLSEGDFKRAFILTDTVSTPSPQPLTIQPDGVPNPSILLETLIPTETRLTNVKTIIDRAAVKSVKKRSIDNPLLNVVKYYAKHKVWENSNTNGHVSDHEMTNDDQNKVNVEDLSVDTLTAVNPSNRNVNDLSVIDILTPVKIIKRSIDLKKHLPENPIQDLSGYLKHKAGVNYVKDDLEEAKIKQFLDKIRHGNRVTAKKYVSALEKSLNRPKRSYYNKKVQPRPSEDPQQDISYYVKNKRGTNIRPDLVQAAQVRAGLERIFQTGNLIVIQRYGANYNPLILNPLVAGAIATVSDF